MKVFPNAVLGYRYFRVSTDGGLSPVSNGGAWPSAVAQAWCLNDRTHLVPDKDCDCGLHACYSIDGLVDIIGKKKNNSKIVIAVVAGSGRTQTHRDGFRSEKMQILQLLGSGDLIEKAAQRYQVPFAEQLLPLPDTVQPMPAEHQKLSEEQVNKLNKETREWSWAKELYSLIRGRAHYPAIHRERSAHDRWMLHQTEVLLFGATFIMFLVAVPSLITGEITHKIVPLVIMAGFICLVLAINFIIRFSTVRKIRQDLREN